MIDVVIGKLLILTSSEVSRLKMKYDEEVVDNAIVKDLDDNHFLIEENRLTNN